MTVIINIAGTNGSGKSTVVRKLLEKATDKRPVPRPGKDFPFGYDLDIPGVDNVVHVMGAYEAPTGGCDNIKDIELVFQRLTEMSKSSHVVYEGAFVMNHTRGPEFVRGADNPFHILLLTTPLGTCFDAIAGRRAEQGKGAFVQRSNIETHHVRAVNYASKMRDAGAKVHRVGRDEAFGELLGILRNA